jgi:protease-4
MAPMRPFAAFRHLSPLLCAVAALAPAPAQETAPPAAPAKPKVHHLRPSGAYADLPEQGFSPMSLLGGGAAQPKAFYPLVAALKDFARDVAATTLLLDLSGSPGLNLAQLRELEREVAAVRNSGKKVIAWLENAGPVQYQLAALCDRVVMADMGMLDLRSPTLHTMHFKDALDLLGVQVEVVRVGDFKGAVEPFSLPEMSRHLREHYQAMLASMNRDVVRRIAEGRKLDPARVGELQARRMFLAREALELGLVDRLVPWEGPRRALAAERGTDDFELVDAIPKKKPRRLDLMSMLGEMFRGRRDDDAIEAPKLVVLHLSGAIGDGDKAAPGSIVSGPAVKDIDALADNQHVKGVVVRINSPGGSATASEAVRRALERLAHRKPVVFSLGEVAASGGYWITCIGAPILAEAGTLTGSIGVFSMRLQPGALMRRIGVRDQLVALDAGAAMDAIDQPWSETARERMQAMVDDVYERFVRLAATSRRMEAAKVAAIAGGRVWSGAQAVDLKLVDAVGGLDEALAMVRRTAGLAEDVEVLHRPEARNLADALMESLFSARALQPGMAALAVLARDVGRLDGLQMLLREALQGGPGRVMAMIPTELRVR